MPIKKIIIILISAGILFSCTEDIQEQVPPGNRGQVAGQEGRGSEVPASPVDERQQETAEDRGNGAPAVSKVALVLSQEGDLSFLKAEVTVDDAEGDEIEIEYRWIKNGESTDVIQDRFMDIRRGDKVRLVVRATDGRNSSPEYDVETEIANMPPRIVHDNDFSFDGIVFTKQIRASDPDGDELSFELAKGPEGMAIDPSTGVLKWSIPPNLSGTFAGSILVSDGHGGTAAYDVEIPVDAVAEENKQ